MGQHSTTSRRADKSESTWALGAVIYAGILLMMAGAFQAFEGLAAIVNDNFFPPGPRLLPLSVTGWGWLHVALGVVVFAAGFKVFDGGMWARVIGISVAAVSAIENFLFIPHHPIWSIVIIALDVVVIWALCVYTGPGDSVRDTPR
jgi:hypothetical protein